MYNRSHNDREFDISRSENINPDSNWGSNWGSNWVVSFSCTLVNGIETTIEYIMSVPSILSIFDS